MNTPTLFTPPDTQQAWDEWRCNCGPASMAAFLGRTCAEIRPYFPGHEKRAYANPTHIREALTSLGVPHRVGQRPNPDVIFASYCGLLLVQFGGPWMQGPVGAQYQRTHWIALREGHVYDLNAGWMAADAWRNPADGFVKELMGHIRRADGSWYIRTALYVRPEDCEVRL